MRGPDKKHRSILDQERAWAAAVARTLTKPRPISAWEVMIPVLLVFTHMHSKGRREVTIQNLTFTKKLALDAALTMVKSDLPRREAHKRLE